jgi:hypothetical protein
MRGVVVGLPQAIRGVADQLPLSFGERVGVRGHSRDYRASSMAFLEPVASPRPSSAASGTFSPEGRRIKEFSAR